jgi:hypothetical protein
MTAEGWVMEMHFHSAFSTPHSAFLVMIPAFLFIRPIIPGGLHS